MNNVLFRLAAGLESRGKGKPRGRQELIIVRDRSETNTFIFLQNPEKLVTVIHSNPRTSAALRKVMDAEVKTLETEAMREVVGTASGFSLVRGKSPGEALRA